MLLKKTGQTLNRKVFCWTALISVNLLGIKSFSIFCGNILWTCFDSSILAETIKNFQASICFSVSFSKGVPTKEYVNLAYSIVFIDLQGIISSL